METQMEKIESFLIDNGIATTEEIRLVMYINGHTIESLNNILYVRTGYRSLEQILDAEY